MISVIGGLAAAAGWGLATLLLASVARQAGAGPSAFWFVAYQAVALAVPVAAIMSTIAWPPVEVIAAACLAGAIQGGGTLCYGSALRRSPVALVAPLVALEGVFAAAFAVAWGESLAGGTLVGLIFASAGGVAAAAPYARSWRSAGTTYAITTAFLFGIVLWVVGTVQLNPLVTVFLVNTVAAVVLGALAGEIRKVRVSRGNAVRLFGSAVAGVVGFLGYTIGARGASVSVTAVIAAQFSVVSAVGGYIIWGERLPRGQLVALGTLMIGVTIVAVTPS